MTSKVTKEGTLFCDGASRGNPGKSAFGFIIFQNNAVVAQKGGCIGNATNNIAEYEGLIEGLKKCLELDLKILTVKSDSQLLVRQINGLYKIKSENLVPLFEKACKLLKRFEKVSIVHIPREENKLADQLANIALDQERCQSTFGTER